MWPFSTIRKLRAEVERLTNENETTRDSANLLLNSASTKIKSLTAELEQARRNDMPRDNKGRFVSKVANG